MHHLEAENEYLKALKQGQKESNARKAKGLNPYPLVLDEILGGTGSDAAKYVGQLDIPAERILGTRSAGRTTTFSAGFLPLASLESEFALKWMNLCCTHVNEGIRDPILCYEYMGNFYVQEGNKRLSVLKYFGSTRISSVVYRLQPPEGDTDEIRVYREFLEFFQFAKVYDVQFSKPGSYARLLKFMGIEAGREWTEEERRKFRAYFLYFKEAFSALGGDSLNVRPEDAMLLWIQIHSYPELGSMSASQLKKSLSTIWENVLAMDSPKPMVRTEAPSTEGKSGLLNRILRPSRIQVAFIHQRTPETSAWTQAHDMGRIQLERALGDSVIARSYFGADTTEQAEAILEQAVAEGAEVVFTTTPQLVVPCLAVSVRHPKVRFLNCSVQMPYSTVHTYYSRIYEGKFITGAIAGAIADNNRIGYVGSYPIYGVPASINAFALGALLTNPRAQIELKWSCTPGNHTQDFLDQGIWVISNRDNPVGNKLFTEYGTYSVAKDGTYIPLGSPVWEWGKFYESVVRSILSGTWDVGGHQAVNDWWGLSSGVIDVTLSEELPEGVRALAMYLRESLRNGTLDPFKRQIYAQDGTLMNDGSRGFTAEELLHMDWLCSNVNGKIPQYDELLPVSKPTVRMLGVYRNRIPLD